MSNRLYALTLCVFAVGVAEFILVGLLPTVAAGVGVSIGDASLLVTVYAIGIAVGSPLLTVAVSRFDARWTLAGLMGLFALGNFAVAASPAFAGLLIGRIASGAAHGAVVAIGASVAASLVGKEREGRAVALVLLGLTAAMVLGVPIGNALGAGIGWRETFVALGALGAVGGLTVLVGIPSMATGHHGIGLREQLGAVKNASLLLSYGVTALAFGASFAVFPFLAPLLHGHAGYSSSAITWLLVLFGGATVIGNLLGGRLADSLGTLRTATLALAGVTVVLIALTISADNRVAIALNLAAWGFFAFMIAPAVQTGVMRVAEARGGDVVKVAGGLNVSAFNIGIAAASFVGGQVVGRFDAIATVWVGVVFAIGAFALIALLRSTLGGAIVRPLPATATARSERI